MFDLKSAEYDSVDPLAMDLLEKMLKVDPSERITASEVLRDPFLVVETMMGEDLS